MTIPGKKEVTIRLGGEDRAWTFDLAALAIAESVLGRPIQFSEIGTLLPTAGGLRAILFAGFKRRDPKLTIDAFDDLLDWNELMALGEKIADVVMAAMPREEDVPKAEAVAVAPAS